MRLTYDPDYNMAHLRFQGKHTEGETIRASGEANADVAPDGSLYGIELLNAISQLTDDASGTLVIVYEVAGQQLGSIGARSTY